MSGKLFDKILFLSMFLWMSVALNLGSLGFVIDGLLKVLEGLNVNVKALIGSSSTIGMFIGALISGFIADWFGRKKAITLFVIVLGISSLLSYLVMDPIWFIIWRVIVGIGMGGLLPVVASLVSEYSVPGNRGRRISLLESSWAYGWLIAVVLAYLLLNSLGWLYYGVLLGILSFLFGIMGLWIEESPRYLLAIGRRDEAIKLAEKYGVPLPEIRPKISMFDGLKKLFAPNYRKTTIGLWILWFTITMG
ncbi:MAG: MFS transporter, partial [Staphylothermus sp.]|nr:MFS transporter [Staphylothermus sp.]